MYGNKDEVSLGTSIAPYKLVPAFITNGILICVHSNIGAHVIRESLDKGVI